MNEKNLQQNYLGFVIRIVDKRTLLVDAGFPTLKVGDAIQVFEVGPEIRNLDGSVLCNYEFIKDTLEVIETTSCYSVCKKMTTEPVRVNALSQLSLSPLLTSQTQYVPLRVKDEDIDPLEIKNPYVCVGDPIKLMS